MEKWGVRDKRKYGIYFYFLRIVSYGGQYSKYLQSAFSELRRDNILKQNDVYFSKKLFSDQSLSLTEEQEEI